MLYDYIQGKFILNENRFWWVKKVWYNTSMRILIQIEYNGKNYCGWQRQKNGTSIQEVLENALQTLLGEKISVQASGRTDAGVHALGQMAHFDLKKHFDLSRLAYAVNPLLPEDIKVVKAKEVKSDFHARFNVHKKTYIYKVYNRKISSPLKKDSFAHYPYDLDFQKMKEACKKFLGVHNFKGFSSEGSSVKGYEREIFAFDVKKNKDEYVFKITGNGFLYNMVRRIVACVLEIGRGSQNLSIIDSAFEHFDKKIITKNMQACGLYLYRVVY